MDNIFNTIPTLTKSTKPNNPHNFQDYLELWEIMLNQQFTQEEVEAAKEEAGDLEELIFNLLQQLYNINRLIICDPLTGEILYHYNTTTQEEYLEESFAAFLTSEEVAVC